MWSDTDEEDHRAAGEEELNNRMERDVSSSLGMEPRTAISGVVYVVCGDYDTPPLNRPLLKPYHRCYIDRLYKHDLLKLRSTQSEE